MSIRKILVADDSPTMRHVLTEALTAHGYQVIVAATGSEAVAKSRAELPDLIIMDVVMPAMNGFQATRAITRDSATQHIPVIFLTHKDQPTDRLWGLRQGAREYVSKSIRMQDL